MAPIDSPLTLSLALLACWAVVGAAGLLRTHSVALVGRVLFPLGAIIGVGSARRTRAVHWGVAGNVVIAWVLTIPASGLMAAGAWWLGRQLL